jgi:ubiquinol-cytochrome c reductase cytochrome b subunit
MPERLLRWLEERTGVPSALKRVLDHPIPGGPRWAYTLGSATLFCLGGQALTGLLLALNYAPTADGARASVRFIEQEVAAGRLIRSLHHWGAGLMIALVGCHLLQVFLWGAYRRPREATWIAGVFLLLLTLGEAFTGSLLPWDQNAYWATQIGVNILGSAPWVGPALQRLVQGGARLGNLTLSRFYALHVAALPLLFAGLAAAHVALFLRRGATPPPALPPQEAERRTAPFWPAQGARDAAVILALLALLLAVAIRFPPALGGAADASKPYDARPEWYFLFLFEMLKRFEGPLEPVGAFVLPGLALLFLLGVPFLDRGRDAPLSKRLGVALPMLAGVAAVGALTAWGLAGDRAERAARLAEETRRADILERGWALVRSQPCLKCHMIGDTGRDVGPSLTRYGLRAPPPDAIVAYLRDPKLKYPQTIMPAFAHLPEHDLRLLAEFLRLQGAD